MLVSGFTLPFDLVCQFATAVRVIWGDHGLTRLCLVSHEFHDAAAPILYRTLMLDTDKLMYHFANVVAKKEHSLRHTRALSPWRDLDDAALQRAARIIDACPNVSNLQTRLDIVLSRCKSGVPAQLETLFTWIDEASWRDLLTRPSLATWPQLRRLHIEWAELRLADPSVISRENLERVFAPAHLPRLKHVSIRWSFDYDFATQFRGSVRRFALLSDVLLRLPSVTHMVWRVPAKYATRALAVPGARDPRVFLDLQDVKVSRTASYNKGMWWDDLTGVRCMWTSGVAAVDFLDDTDSPASDSS